MNYDPNSTDSMLSKILERMDSQDAKLESIHKQTMLTNGRVSAVEVWKNQVHGNVTVIAAFLSAGVSALTAWVIKRS